MRTRGVALVLFTATCFSHGAVPAQIPDGSPPPGFVANRGQWPADVRFRYRQGPATAWVHDDGLSLALVHRRPSDPLAASTEGRPPLAGPAERVALRWTFEGAAPASAPRGGDELGVRHNFYLGNDPRRWATAVPSFGRVEQAGLMPGVDVVWRQRDGLLTYDLEIAPGGDPAAIVTRIDGARALRVGANGELVVQTALGDVALTAPRSWEVTPVGTRLVDSRFSIVDAQRYRISVERVDERAPLLIDPGFEWGTYLGGANVDLGTAVRTDDKGRVYVTGWTEDPGGGAPFPTTTSVAYGGGPLDVFVSCLDPSQSGTPQLVWSTYIGGRFGDVGQDLHVDSSGALTTVVGYTRSNDFPTTAGAHRPALIGAADAIVSQLTSTGALAYSSYLGGLLNDRACAIESHPAGGFLIAGYTNSTDLPGTSGEFQPARKGGFDAFAMHFDPLQAAPVRAATYLGGSQEEGVWVSGGGVINHDWLGAAVGPGGDVVITGIVKSADFPTTAGAFQTAPTGGVVPNDIFVSCLDATLTSLKYSTYVGSTSEDAAWDVAMNGDGDLVVTGFSYDDSFPTTPGAFRTTRVGSPDAVIFVLRPAGMGSQDLRYSTFLGDTVAAFPGDVAVESSGIITTCGYTAGGLPVTPGAMQTQFGTFVAGFVLRLDPAGAGASDLHYASYVGGPGQGT